MCLISTLWSLLVSNLTLVVSKVYVLQYFCSVEGPRTHVEEDTHTHTLIYSTHTLIYNTHTQHTPRITQVQNLVELCQYAPTGSGLKFIFRRMNCFCDSDQEGVFTLLRCTDHLHPSQCGPSACESGLHVLSDSHPSQWPSGAHGRQGRG